MPRKVKTLTAKYYCYKQEHSLLLAQTVGHPISFGSAEAFFTAGLAGRTYEDRVWVKRRLSHEPNQMHNHVNVYQCISKPQSVYFHDPVNFG